MPQRPTDQCPYPRPFPRGFSRCPAFRAVAIDAVDSRHRPLPGALTCAHLDVGVATTAGRFYPRCTVGTAADREAWARTQGAGAEVRGTPADRRGARQRRG